MEAAHVGETLSRLAGIDSSFGTNKPKFVCSKETLKELLLAVAWLDNSKLEYTDWMRWGMALKYEIPEAFELFECKSNEWGRDHKQALDYVWSSFIPEGDITGRTIFYLLKEHRLLHAEANGHSTEILPVSLQDIVDGIYSDVSPSLPSQAELATKGIAVVDAIIADQEQKALSAAGAIRYLRDKTWFDPQSWTGEIYEAMCVLALDDPNLWLEGPCLDNRNTLIAASLVQIGWAGGCAVRGLPITRAHTLRTKAELENVFRGAPRGWAAKGATKAVDFLRFIAESKVERADYSRVIAGYTDPFPVIDGKLVVNRWIFEGLPHWHKTSDKLRGNAWSAENVALFRRQIYLLAGVDTHHVIDMLSWFAKSIWHTEFIYPRLSFALLMHSLEGAQGKSTLALLLKKMAGRARQAHFSVSYSYDMDASGISRFDSAGISDAIVIELPEIDRERGKDAHIEQTLKALLPSQDPDALYRSEAKGRDAVMVERSTALVIGTTNKIEALYTRRQERRALIVSPPDDMPEDAASVRQRFYDAVIGQPEFVSDILAWLVDHELSPGFQNWQAPRTAAAEYAFMAGADGLMGEVVEIIEGDNSPALSPYGPVWLGSIEARLTVRHTAQSMAKCLRALGFDSYRLDIWLKDTDGKGASRKFTIWSKKFGLRGIHITKGSKGDGRQQMLIQPDNPKSFLAKLLPNIELVRWPELVPSPDNPPGAG